MESSTGKHYIALDHVRALAAMLVFTWHFVHAGNGYIVPYTYTPSIPLFSLLNEGHTGVSLFMALSGYLFAKLLDGKRIGYRRFLYNRCLRLIPLLSLVIVAVGILQVLYGGNLLAYLRKIIAGILLPTLPNGGWSITIEFHFYMLLPFLLWIARKQRNFLMVIIVIAILFRYALFIEKGAIRSLAFFTLIGRLDQFLLGILAYEYRKWITRRHITAVFVLVLFTVIYWWFDRNGGFYNTQQQFSVSRFWVVLPTLEGLMYGWLISWYDNSFTHPTNRLSVFWGKLGSYSYSLYLLHFFFVFDTARLIDRHVLNLSNFYVAAAAAIVCFTLMYPVGFLSFHLIEKPFLTFRKHYIID